MTVEEMLHRLVSKTNIVEDCWLFGKDKNYGRLTVKYKEYHSHRISAYIFHNLDLDNIGLQALHKPICPNRSCWNPNHIYVGTFEDNARDKKLVRGNKCGKGHELTFRNSYINSRGVYECKKCRRDAQRKFKERKEGAS